jgi:hypothetical protein
VKNKGAFRLSEYGALLVPVKGGSVIERMTGNPEVIHSDV